jgi:hypothetical protein
MVTGAGSGGHLSSTPCPNPIEFRGMYDGGTGKPFQVIACIDHAADISEWKRINAIITPISDASKSPFRKDN